jgi:hypothetical protein
VRGSSQPLVDGLSGLSGGSNQITTSAAGHDRDQRRLTPCGDCPAQLIHDTLPNSRVDGKKMRKPAGFAGQVVLLVWQSTMGAEHCFDQDSPVKALTAAACTTDDRQTLLRHQQQSRGDRPSIAGAAERIPVSSRRPVALPAGTRLREPLRGEAASAVRLPRLRSRLLPAV